MRRERTALGCIKITAIFKIESKYVVIHLKRVIPNANIIRNGTCVVYRANKYEKRMT